MDTKPGLIVAVTALGASNPQDGELDGKTQHFQGFASSQKELKGKAERHGHCPFPIPRILIYTKNTAVGNTASAAPHLPPDLGWNRTQMEKAQVEFSTIRRCH